MISSKITRRTMMNRAVKLAGLGAGAPLAMQLASVGDAAAMDANDYRALVCVFLYGGSDYANTLVPYDLVNYGKYARIRGGSDGKRGGIAYGHDELTPTALRMPTDRPLTDDIAYALAPTMPRLAGLFNTGKVAVQLNIGPLVTPLTKRQFEGNNRSLYPIPPKLFSHNDQQSIWQALGSEGATVGWGGRLGDLAMSNNQNSLLTCISTSGNAVFLSGHDALQYQASVNGAIKVEGLYEPVYGFSGVSAALGQLMRQPSVHGFKSEMSTLATRSIAMEGVVNGALANVSNMDHFPAMGQNNLADQMRIVARLIGARQQLGLKRQVFFVSLEGFDHHNELMLKHPGLMAKLDEAMGAFYQATEALGVADKVTTFTASDFGRTLTSNSDGSDHGWGSHHFVMGGAVKGGQFYGTAPHISTSTDDQVGQGRLLPTTSVDQFAATLARWFGVSECELPVVLPRIGNFSNHNLGFL